MTSGAYARTSRAQAVGMLILSPRQLVAAVPHLLNFHPAESLVIVGLDDSSVEAIVRTDLGDNVDSALGGFLAAMRHCSAPAYVALVYSKAPVSLSVVSAAVGALADLTQLDVLHVGTSSWRSLLCDDDGCCPPGGHALDSAHPLSVQFIAMGSAPFGSREELDASLRSRELTTADKARRQGAYESVTHVDTADAAAAQWLFDIVTCHDALDWPNHARLASMLGDYRWRDALLRHLLDAPEARLAARVTLADTVSRCLPSLVAPCATTLAGCVWLDGNGVMARIALDLALETDPEYSLARLLDRALQTGVPPKVWCESLEAVTVDECLAA